MEIIYYMSNIKTKVLYECMELKEHRVSDFVPKFSEFHQSDDLSRFVCENIENNLIILEKRSKNHFEKRIAFCTSRKSNHIVKNGTYEKNLFF